MESPVVDIGFADQHGHAGGIDGFVGQDGKFLEDHAQVRILGQQLCHVGQGGAAIAAIVVEKFDERDVAIGIADHYLARIVEDGLLHRSDGGGGLFAFLGAQRGIKRDRHALENLGVAHQVGFDERVDGLGRDCCHGLRGGCAALAVIGADGIIDHRLHGDTVGLWSRMHQRGIAQGASKDAREGDKGKCDA